MAAKMFSNECRVSLYENDDSLRIWRRIGQRYNQECFAPVIAYNGGSVMVWAAISYNSRTDLVIIPEPGGSSSLH